MGNPANSMGRRHIPQLDSRSVATVFRLFGLGKAEVSSSARPDLAVFSGRCLALDRRQQRPSIMDQHLAPQSPKPATASDLSG